MSIAAARPRQLSVSLALQQKPSTIFKHLELHHTHSDFVAQPAAFEIQAYRLRSLESQPLSATSTIMDAWPQLQAAISMHEACLHAFYTHLSKKGAAQCAYGSAAAMDGFQKALELPHML